MIKEILKVMKKTDYVPKSCVNNFKPNSLKELVLNIFRERTFVSTTVLLFLMQSISYLNPLLQHYSENRPNTPRYSFSPLSTSNLYSKDSANITPILTNNS